MKKLLASLILLIMVINILPAASSISDGASVEYIPPAYSLGIGISPTSKLHVNGTTATKGFTLNGNTFSILPSLSQGSILFASETGKFAAVNNGAGSNHYGLKMNGNTVVWEPLASSSAATNINGLSDARSSTYNVYLGNGAGLAADTGASYSTGVGIQALHNNVSASGTHNSAFGYQAMNGNTTGSDNTAIGYKALYSNDAGGDNTAIGARSLYFNTTGSHNVAIGDSSLTDNTTGYYNIAIGDESLNDNTTGAYNVAIGDESLRRNIAGEDNTAIGYLALNDSTSGSNNTAIGSRSLNNNTISDDNTAIGDESRDS